MIMLKFLTHKLRTHSINEENYIEKVEDDKDSGTESDDEIEEVDLPTIVMSTRSSPTYSVASPLDLQDAHSSEEELEVINRPASEESAPSSGGFAGRESQPEKRKWSQAVGDHEGSLGNEENVSRYGNIRKEDLSTSSDEEVHSLLGMSTPVQFRTSPPLEAFKPGQGPHGGPYTSPCPYNGTGIKAGAGKGRSLSPPPHKVVHYEVSPRKRVRHARQMQRPCLDFEKMQQLKARSVTAWRNSGDHGGELSVFCW